MPLSLLLLGPVMIGSHAGVYCRFDHDDMSAATGRVLVTLKALR